MTAATAIAEFSQTPQIAISTRPITTQTNALIALRLCGVSAAQRSGESPALVSAAHQAAETAAAIRRATSGAFGRSLAEQALRPEHKDEDENREHDRLRPCRSRRVPREPLVVRLDEADAQRAEHGSRQVADASEHRRS